MDGDRLVRQDPNCDWCFRSENFLVRWDSTGMPKEIEKLNNLPALFTVAKINPLPLPFVPIVSNVKDSLEHDTSGI